MMHGWSCGVGYVSLPAVRVYPPDDTDWILADGKEHIDVMTR